MYAQSVACIVDAHNNKVMHAQLGACIMQLIIFCAQLYDIVWLYGIYGINGNHFNVMDLCNGQCNGPLTPAVCCLTNYVLSY